VELINNLGISSSQQNQRINAIKFYYEKVLDRTKADYKVERPKKARNGNNRYNENGIYWTRTS
jgi:integrase/recombinase XerD